MKPYTIPIAYTNGKQVPTVKLHNAQQIHFDSFYKQITSVQPEFLHVRKVNWNISQLPHGRHLREDVST